MKIVKKNNRFLEKLIPEENFVDKSEEREQERAKKQSHKTIGRRAHNFNGLVKPNPTNPDNGNYK